MSLPAAYLVKKLTKPLPIRRGAVLRTIGFDSTLRFGSLN
jgi:hypothetical protein